jgi:hypothetical protein
MVSGVKSPDKQNGGGSLGIRRRFALFTAGLVKPGCRRRG